MTILQDQNLRYVRKPHGLPTTFGSQRSFLEELFAEGPGKEPNSALDFVQSQRAHRSREDEYGLLNRLDNDTAGLLYFAKTPAIKEQFKALQAADKLQKLYIADVPLIKGSIRQIISYPIGHNASDPERMVAIKNPRDLTKIRGTAHQAITHIQKLYNDEDRQTSTLLVTIAKGTRHQIRCHLASIDHPIIGDPIYNKNPWDKTLHLRSIGLSSTNP